MVRKEKADVVVTKATKNEIEGHIKLRARKLEIPFVAHTKNMRGIKVELDLPERLEEWDQSRIVKKKIQNVCGKINIPYSEVFEVKW